MTSDPMDKATYYNCLTPLTTAWERARNEEDVTDIVEMLDHSHAEYERVFSTGFWPTRDSSFERTKRRLKGADSERYGAIVEELVDEAFDVGESVEITP